MSALSHKNKLDHTAVETLRSTFDGSITLPGDENYDEARAVWNGMIDRYPALIAYCATVHDVIASVNFARHNELPMAVRGGGHNVAGHATIDDGIVIDLSLMNRIQVDPKTNTVKAAGGATLGELDAATQAYGLVVPSGVFSDTGIGGLTLGGGYGWIRNKFGLTCDNLIAAQVVTASGEVIYADENQNQDLLWGLRGGGGNFGIVTEFTFRAYQLGPEVMFTFVMHDGRTAEDMERAVRFYRDFVANAPDEVGSLLALGKIPPEEAFPEELHMTPFVLFVAMYAGPAEEGQKVLQPLVDYGKPLVDMSGIMPYVEAQQAFDHDYPNGRRYYWKSLNLTRFDDEAIKRFVANARQQPSPFSTTDLWDIGGEVKRVSGDESAFYGRDAMFLLNPEANWLEAKDDQANIEWARNFIADMEQFSDGSRYLNFAGFQEEGDQMMKNAFGPNYARLAELKRKYDPDNVFSRNQNIKPGA